MPNRLHGGFLLILCLILSTFPASALTSASASLSNPNIDLFPWITAYLDVHDYQGNFFYDLSSEQVTVLEDGSPLPVARLQQICPGVQFVVAIDPGPSFGIRNYQAVSRYDLLKENLKSWANNRLGSNVDDLSLIITDGPSVSHVTNAKDWLAVLETELVNPRVAIPNIDTLFHAVSLAADQLMHPGMGRSVLYITPPPEGNSDQTLKNLITQASEQGISINVWMVTSGGAYASQSVEQLTAMAEGTGGKFFTFTGTETLPDIEEYLKPLRSIYMLEYQSTIRGSGLHQLAVQVQTGGELIKTEIQSFEIDLQPPIPAFVSPPINILRQPSNELNVMAFKQAQAEEVGNLKSIPNNSSTSFTPTDQTLQVVVDFPDGRKRDLVRTSLIVDGAIVVQNLQPPFDQFRWALESYNENGIHNIQVQAEDTLGLTGSSITLPVQIIIEHPSQDYWAPIRKNLPIISILIALFAAGILFLVLITGRKLRPGILRVSRHHGQKHDSTIQRISMGMEMTARGVPKWVNRMQISHTTGTPRPLAYLSCISATDELSTLPPIPISSSETTFGSGVDQASLVINDPSLEPLHARLRRESDGSFYLFDESSVAGTWVNYSPVPKEGARLEHGDLVYIGRVGFRFLLSDPSQKRKPQIIQNLK